MLHPTMLIEMEGKNGNEPLVSIIVSSYNYDQYLSECIDSALAQTYQNAEVIVIDDGSTDDSRSIIRDYEGRIKYLIKENGGQASAFNTGFAISKGDIIIFLDSDDRLAPNVAKLIIPFFADTKVSKVHWILEEIDEAGRKTKKVTPSWPLSEGDLKTDVVQLGPSKCGGPPFSPPTSGNAWSRKFLTQVFPIPEADYKTCTDQYLQVLAPVYGHIRKIDQPLGAYRVHGQNYSHNPMISYMHEFLDRFEKSSSILLDHLQKNGKDIPSHQWPRDSWFHRISDSLNEIVSIVPEGATFILADDNDWGLPTEYQNRKHKYFIDRNGAFWGHPENDEQAINEIKRLHDEGAKTIFFAWTAFWMLDYYSKMHQHLKLNGPCIIDNERLIGFKLD